MPPTHATNDATFAVESDGARIGYRSGLCVGDLAWPKARPFDPKTRAFLAAIVAASPLFQRAWRSEVDYWEDKGGVMTTIVMAHFANAICDEIGELNPIELDAIFSVLDELLLRGDQETGEAIATGFLEAMLSDAANGRLDLNRVRSYIGPEAAEYCRAWDPKTFNAST